MRTRPGMTGSRTKELLKDVDKAKHHFAVWLGRTEVIVRPQVHVPEPERRADRSALPCATDVDDLFGCNPESRFVCDLHVPRGPPVDLGNALAENWVPVFHVCENAVVVIDLHDVVDRRHAAQSPGVEVLAEE